LKLLASVRRCGVMPGNSSEKAVAITKRMISLHIGSGITSHLLLQTLLAPPLAFQVNALPIWDKDIHTCLRCLYYEVNWGKIQTFFCRSAPWGWYPNTYGRSGGRSTSWIHSRYEHLKLSICRRQTLIRLIAISLRDLVHAEK